MQVLLPSQVTGEAYRPNYLPIFAVLGVLLGLTMPKFKVMQSLIDRLNLVSRDMLDGVMPIRAFGREQFELDRFDNASSDLMLSLIHISTSSAIG